MNMKNGVFLVISIVASILFINNSIGEANEAKGVTDNSIKIGIILDQTGPATGVTIPITQAMRTYARHINDHGGVNGRKLKMCVEDDRYSIPPALAAFKKLAYRDRVFVFMGPSSASLINVIAKSIQKVKLPTISVTFPEVTVKPFKKYIFIVTGTYGGQVRAIVDYMVKDYGLKEPRIGLVYPDTEAGKTDVRAALPRLKKYNLEPVTKEILMAGSLDATSQVMNLKKHKVNCVLNMGTIPASTITLLRGLKKFGLNIPTFSSYGAMGNEELNKIGEAGNQAYSVFPFSTWYGKGPGLEVMRKTTLKYYPGTEKPYRGAVYTLGWGMSVVLVEGLTRAGRNLDEDAFIKALESLKSYDTGGLCPPITFSSVSHKGGGSWKIFRTDSASGKFIAVTGWKKSD